MRTQFEERALSLQPTENCEGCVRQLSCELEGKADQGATTQRYLVEFGHHLPDPSEFIFALAHP